MGNFAQQPIQRSAPMNPFLGALFSAMPQLQQMMPQQTTNTYELWNPAMQQVQPQQQAWSPNAQQLQAYQQNLARPDLQGIGNRESVAAHMALFGENYGGLRDFGTDQFNQVSALMQSPLQRGNGLPPTSGHGVGAAGQISDRIFGGGFQGTLTGPSNPFQLPANPHPMQTGVMQMQPAATLNSMPSPMQKTENLMTPKKNSWGL